ncbi:MAG: aldehyde dehydrogenase family protein [Betaproteobacteria bacterium]
MLAVEDTFAIPLWINGRAYLTVTSEFHDVSNPLSGSVLRRTPCCGAIEAQQAVASAQLAHASWVVLAAGVRAGLLNALGELLASYATHFAAMIAEETGQTEVEAGVEVAACVDLLCHAVAYNAVPDISLPGVVAIIGAVKNPFLGVLQLAIPLLLKGEVLIMRPYPEAPSALFALAELSGRCGFPAGVLNVLYGDQLIVDELGLAGARLCFA